MVSASTPGVSIVSLKAKSLAGMQPSQSTRSPPFGVIDMLELGVPSTASGQLRDSARQHTGAMIPFARRSDSPEEDPKPPFRSGQLADHCVAFC